MSRAAFIPTEIHREAGRAVEPTLRQSTMRIAALYDIHGNLPALDAVLNEVERKPPDLILIGGDVWPGPLPAESLRPTPKSDHAGAVCHGQWGS
jgi:predicted MPP superfamily phosphohydrolase